MINQQPQVLVAPAITMGVPGMPVVSGAPMIVINGGDQSLVSCTQIVCGCVAPQFRLLHQVIGGLTMCYGGSALSCGVCCCCYGGDRKDCMDVWLSGVVLSWAMGIGYGYVASCFIGLKMVGLMR